MSEVAYYITTSDSYKTSSWITKTYDQYTDAKHVLGHKRASGDCAGTSLDKTA